MNDTTNDASSSTRRSTRRRAPLVAVAVVLATFGAACSPSPNGGFDIALGGTLPLPTIATQSSAQQVLGCVYYNTPAINIAGASATIPGINVQLTGVITVPNVQVHLPSVAVNLGTISVCDFGNIDLPAIQLPLDVVATGQMNLATMQLSLSGIVITTYINLFGMDIPINIPLDTITIQL